VKEPGKMQDREMRGLRGPVRSVVTEIPKPEGALLEELHFDLDGRMTYLRSCPPQGAEWSKTYRYDHNGHDVDRNIRVVRAADGGHTELEKLPGYVDAWSAPHLHGMGFGAQRTSAVESSFDAKGQPTRTVLRNEHGEELSTIRYVCDESGNVVEAVQYSGSVSPFGLSPDMLERVSRSDRGKFQAFFEPGLEEARITFRYDSARRPTEEAAYLVGELQHRTVYTYNEQGDRVTATSDGGDPVRLEYEYDHYGNWTRQVVHHALGADDIRRRLSYYAPES
jgi:hypothetical protein